MIFLSTFSHGVPNPDASQKGVVLDQPFRYPHVLSVNLDTGSRHGDEPRRYREDVGRRIARGCHKRAACGREEGLTRYAEQKMHGR